MKKIMLCLIAFIAFSATCPAQKNLVNLAYGNDKQQTLDLFLPKIFDEKTPVIVMIHGGAWMMGGKEYTDKHAKDLRDRGFVIANIDYRYVSESVHGKDLLQDIENAVGYILKEGKEHGYATNQVHIAGVSAGAHLSLLYGYTAKNVKSITAICAPTRLDDRATMEHLQKVQLTKNVELLAGANYDIMSVVQDKKFTDVSPYSHVKNVPTLLIHGDADQLVPYSQAVYLYGALQIKKIDSKLITMKDKGHDAGMNDPVSEKQVLNAITDWVNTHN